MRRRSGMPAMPQSTRSTRSSPTWTSHVTLRGSPGSATFPCTPMIMRRSVTRERLAGEAKLARELGFDVVLVERTPLMDTPGWRIENQAVFHPRKYLRGLLDACAADGCVICEGNDVTFGDDLESVHARPSHDSRPPRRPGDAQSAGRSIEHRECRPPANPAGALFDLRRGGRGAARRRARRATGTRPRRIDTCGSIARRTARG